MRVRGRGPVEAASSPELGFREVSYGAFTLAAKVMINAVLSRVTSTVTVERDAR